MDIELSEDLDNQKRLEILDLGGLCPVVVLEKLVIV